MPEQSECYADNDWPGVYCYGDAWHTRDSAGNEWFSVTNDEWLLYKYTFIAWRKKPEFVKYEPYTKSKEHGLLQ